MINDSDNDRIRDPFYLPNFCSSSAVFGTVLIAVVTAFMMSLVRVSRWEFFFDDLAKTALVIVWTALATAAVLCVLRKWLMRVFRGASSDKPDEDFEDFPQGVHVTVLKTITPANYGRIQYRGTTWDAAADETIEAGNTVEIIRYADNSHQIYFVRKINQP